MNNKLTFSVKHPIWTVTIIELLVIILMTAAGAYATIMELDYTAPVLIAFAPIALALMIYFTWRRKWQRIGFRSLRTISRSDWLYYLPLIAVLVLYAMNGIKPVTGSEVLYCLFVALLVGFVEETIYRGLIFQTLVKKSIPAAVITSTLLFFLTHMLNLLSGQDMLDTVLQLIYALLIGLTLVLFVLKTGNIIPGILFHFVHNLFQDQFIGNTSTMTQIIIVMCVMAAVSTWLAIDLKRTKQWRQWVISGTVNG
ncbi:CPBP family intramembrane metalloprotease [Paenibacillus albiflavus]|uniref:CPBP family intramembrane metalloprotease n=1 Tax=Paenibacillus albiflavus TaxID=2545760 RepID=A0A4R4EEK2_9BACL|nr:CPBP family intramembrane glutamic endopeptidase [Paenibacillus albiflavus]TCZ76601.1 CPBP family intramembrane metalloprotease [Paenibacillus albiflavus]